MSDSTGTTKTLASWGLKKLALWSVVLAALLVLHARAPEVAHADAPYVPIPDRSTDCPADDDFEDWADTMEDIADRAEAADAAGDTVLLGAICAEWYAFLEENNDDILAAKAGIDECKAQFTAYESCQLTMKLDEIAAAEIAKEAAEAEMAELETRKSELEERKLALALEKSDREHLEDVIHALERSLAETCARIDSLRDSIIPDRERAVALAEEALENACEDLDTAIALLVAAGVAAVYAEIAFAIAYISGNPWIFIPVGIILLIAYANYAIAAAQALQAEEEKAYRKALLENEKARLENAKQELDDQTQYKMELEEELARLREELANSRTLEEIEAELESVCAELDAVMETIADVQDRIAKLDEKISMCKAMIPALEEALQEACDYFVENHIPNFTRYNEATARVSPLWGL